jgi:ABC-2 type transport system ATP-binding protein
MSSIVQVRGLTKSFGGRAVLAGLDLELPAGTTTVLLGENGAGKSTLVRLLLGLERPDTGAISIAGLDPLRDGNQVRSRVGFVPDRPDVYDWMTPKELYTFLRPQYPRWSAAIEERLVDRWKIPERRTFAELSRGEAAKAMLVAALAPRPHLYLLDETFEGLDPLVRDEVLAGFIEELDLEGASALFVTHALDHAARLADRVAVLAGGRIVLCSGIEDALGRDHEGHRPRRLKELLGEAVLEGSATR